MIIWFLLPLLSPRGEKELRSAAAAICVISQKNEPKVRRYVAHKKRGGNAAWGDRARRKRGAKNGAGYSVLWSAALC